MTILSYPTTFVVLEALLAIGTIVLIVKTTRLRAKIRRQLSTIQTTDVKDSAELQKSCVTCAHRYGTSKEYYRCSRTGYYCDNELKYGGRCADGTVGKELRLWTPRKSILQRLYEIFRRGSS